MTNIQKYIRTLSLSYAMICSIRSQYSIVKCKSRTRIKSIEQKKGKSMIFQTWSTIVVWNSYPLISMYSFYNSWLILIIEITWIGLTFIASDILISYLLNRYCRFSIDFTTTTTNSFMYCLKCILWLQDIDFLFQNGVFHHQIPLMIIENMNTFFNIF